MAVMVTFTLKTDVKTYRGMHDQMLGLAIPAGMLFHSAHEDGNQVAIVDFWPSAEAWQSFADGALREGMKAGGIAPPDDLEITSVLDADSR
jgi:hypothetical protein